VTLFTPTAKRPKRLLIGSRYIIVDEHHTCCGRHVEAVTQLMDNLVACLVVSSADNHFERTADGAIIDETHVGAMLFLHPIQVKIVNKNAKS
jgi:hypothetical protein